MLFTQKANLSRLFAIQSSAIAIVATLGWNSTACAQEMLVDSFFGINTGFEGANPGNGSVAWQMARLRLNMGVDFGTTEKHRDFFGVRGFVDLTTNTSLGFEFRYTRWALPWLGAFCGLTTVVAPETLFGFEAGATFNIPLLEPAGIYIEPKVAALPWGSDRANDSVVIWTLLEVGVRLRI